jgi:putative peptidoglycan lipid II flippase
MPSWRILQTRRRSVANRLYYVKLSRFTQPLGCFHAIVLIRATALAYEPTRSAHPQYPVSITSTGSKPGESRTGKLAFLAGAGMLLSRMMGLVRQSIFSHYFGLSDAGDAFTQAFRIPNLLQNLFGEGVLSASFIPVYANLVARGQKTLSQEVAGAIATILALVSSILVLLGVLATPLLINGIAPGFHGEKRELTIHLVRILFPGAGMLVMSAWCLGILNSHRQFFLSYASPVLWNVAMIATLLWYGPGSAEESLAVTLAWGSVAGCALQAMVQLPSVFRVLGRAPLSLGRDSLEVRTVLSNFGPVFISRGVVQLSAYIDLMIASGLPTGAPTALNNAQLLYILPVSLFGMTISAAELPAMSSLVGSESEVAGQLRQRLNASLQRIAFFTIPSVAAFLFLGDIIAAAIFQTGRFKAADSFYVWQILAGSSIGLLASTMGRLYSSTYYALKDTRTPLRFAIIRVVLTTILGYLCALPLPRILGLDPRLGAIGLTATAGIAGWVEFLLLRRKLNQRIGSTGLRVSRAVKLWGAALLAVAVAWGVKLALGPRHPWITAAAVLGPYGAIYLGATYLMGVARYRRTLP